MPTTARARPDSNQEPDLVQVSHLIQVLDPLISVHHSIQQQKVGMGSRFKIQTYTF